MVGEIGTSQETIDGHLLATIGNLRNLYQGMIVGTTGGRQKGRFSD
jgi:hypothetical protein